MKKILVLLAVLFGTGTVWAQPAPGQAPTEAPAQPATGAPAQASPQAVEPFLMKPPGSPGATSDARSTCVKALQTDSLFAAWVLEKGYEVQSARCADLDETSAKRRLQLDLAQHEVAAARVATNERHVILAYAAMWLVAAAFVIFLWLRQRALRGEIDQLRRELDAALKDGT